MPTPFRLLMALAAVFMVAPGVTSDLYSLVLALPVLIQQVRAYQQEQNLKPASA